MADPVRYALLKPDVLGTVGYAYGKTIGPADRRGVFEVARVASGRWHGMEEKTTKLSSEVIEGRSVSETEALSGIGTFVGGAICVARVPPGKPKVWDYGAVVGYSWDDTNSAGLLQVAFVGETVDVPYRESELQDLALETYALRPCSMRGVTDIMAGEMRSIHQAACDHF